MLGCILCMQCGFTSNPITIVHVHARDVVAAEEAGLSFLMGVESIEIEFVEYVLRYRHHYITHFKWYSVR